MSTFHNSRRSWVEQTFVSGVLLVHAGLLGYSAIWQSPTLCEPGHLAGGMSIWRLGRFDVYRVNPPLVRAVAAIPVLFAGAKTDWQNYTTHPNRRCEVPLGMDFFADNGTRS